LTAENPHTLFHPEVGQFLAKNASTTPSARCAQRNYDLFANLTARDDDELHAGEVITDAALPAGATFRLEFVDEVDDVEETATGAGANAGLGRPR
jgi:hypothetical protein